jgi:hypothetical protein
MPSEGFEPAIPAPSGPLGSAAQTIKITRCYFHIHTYQREFFVSDIYMLKLVGYIL